MLETHLTSPITRRRLRTGVAADHIDAFTDWLHLQGYRPTSIGNGLTSLAAWTDWMLTAGFTTQDIVPGFEACKLAIGKEQRVRFSRGPNQQSITAASLFIRFLQLQGKLPPPIAKPCATERWPILGEFHSWMRSHRGLTETTLALYRGILSGLLDVLGDDAHAYSAQASRTFVLERAPAWDRARQEHCRRGPLLSPLSRSHWSMPSGHGTCDSGFCITATVISSPVPHRGGYRASDRLLRRAGLRAAR